MAEKKTIGLRLTDETLQAIRDLIPERSAGTDTEKVRFVATWAAELLQDGVREGLRAVPDEIARRAIVGACNGWHIEPQPMTTCGQALAWEVHDYLTIGEGAAWGVSAEDLERITQALAALAPHQAMGLICWAAAFWRDTSRDFREYCRAGL